MAFVYADRVKETSTTTGTGTLNLAGAATGYRTFVAGIGTTNTCPYVIEDADGTAWEVGIGTVTDATPDTLARTTLLASSTGSAISLSAGTHRVYCSWTALGAQNSYQTDQTYIRGLMVTKNAGAQTIDVSAGACYDPSSGKVISYPGATNISVGTLNTVSDQWNQVYAYDNAGTAAIEVAVNTAAPSTTYAGTARQGGTNSNRRWVGSFLSNSAAAGSVIVNQAMNEIAANAFEVFWPTKIRPLSAETQTTFTAKSLVTCCPRYVAKSINCWSLLAYATTAADDLVVDWSRDGTNTHAQARGYLTATNRYSICSYDLAIETSTPQLYYKLTVVGSAVGPLLYLDVGGYKAVR